MKISRAKFNLSSVAGGVVGGMAASFVENLDLGTAGETDYITPAVQIAAGAALSAFIGGDFLKGVGNGMIGVGGYVLGKALGITEEKVNTSSNTATSGLGLLPTQYAVGSLAPSKKETVKTNVR